MNHYSRIPLDSLYVKSKQIDRSFLKFLSVFRFHIHIMLMRIRIREEKTDPDPTFEWEP